MTEDKALMFKGEQMKKSSICVRSTTDYKMIKHIGGNRVVNPKNVESIKLSMAEKQLIVPSILNEKMQIIDGQHRHAACEALNLPFYYIIVDGYRLKDVQRVNANMSNWTVYDFLDSFIDLYKTGMEEYSHYVELKQFLEDTELPLPTALILSDISLTKEVIVTNFKNGLFMFKNKQMALDIAEAMKDFEPYDQSKWKQTTFALMFSKLFFNDMYSHNQMLRNLPNKSNMLSLMGNRKATLTYLIEIYNYKLARNKRIYANVIEDAWSDMLSNKKGE